MRLGILSRGDGWHVQDLIRASREAGHVAVPLDFREQFANDKAEGTLDGYDSLLVRTMPAGSLEQIVFRMDLLHICYEAGRCVLNPPRAVEVCVDKYLTSARLAAKGIPTPRTIACQTLETAMAAYEQLGGDVVIKPLFGAEGRGIVRVNDADLAWRTIHAIVQMQGVVYLQEFIAHPGWDVRAFVIDDKVIATMKRVNPTDWRTNVARGGTTEHFELAPAEAELAVRAAKTTGAVVAGVDLLPTRNGDWTVIEVNAVPGWRALAETCGRDIARDVVNRAVQR